MKRNPGPKADNSIPWITAPIETRHSGLADRDARAPRLSGKRLPAGPGSYTIGACPICGQPSVLFDECGTPAALMAVSEVKKRPGYVMLNTRPHDLPKKGKTIWHIIEREVTHEL